MEPWFIINSEPDIARLMRASHDVNNGKTDWVVERAEALIEDHPYANVACLGLAFKANIDDLRESPAMKVAHSLASKYRARLKGVEPNLRRLPWSLAELASNS